MSEELYDYSQPVTIGSNINLGGTPQQPFVKVENPFNTDAEACVEFYFSNATSGIVSIAADMPPSQSSATLGANPSDNNNASLGYVFPCPLTSGFHSEYYFPVKQYVALYANFTGAGFIMVIGWRRKREAFNPDMHPMKEFSEPTM